MLKHKEYLKTAFESGKLSHAYILSGNDTEAKLRCTQDFVAFVTGRQQQKLVHADIFSLEPEKGIITIGQIRKLKDFASLSAWQLPLKIVMIDQAQRMNQQAQSAFLKLLEEPKGPMVFLLLVQHAASLLDTISSRAQELRFYHFESKREPEKLWGKLANLPLAKRFSFAKEWGEDDSKRDEVFSLLLAEGRVRLHALLPQKSQLALQQQRKLKLLQEVQALCSQTEVNPKLALERVLLELS